MFSFPFPLPVMDEPGDKGWQAGGVQPSRGSERVSDRITLKGLNVSDDLDKLLRHLRSLDRHLRSGATHDPRQMNILLSGPPGTGKSELAVPARFESG